MTLFFFWDQNTACSQDFKMSWTWPNFLLCICNCNISLLGAIFSASHFLVRCSQLANYIHNQNVPLLIKVCLHHYYTPLLYLHVHLCNITVVKVMAAIALKQRAASVLSGWQEATNAETKSQKNKIPFDLVGIH